MISLIVAVSTNNVIGADGDLPWRLPEDLRRFKALTTGEMDDVDDMVADDFHAYANGVEVVDSASGDGAAAFKQNIEYWRTTVPNLSVDLYEEVSQKDAHNTDSIAVRYVVSGTLPVDGSELPFVIEAAAFVKVVDHEITEWRVVVDETFFEELRAAMGLPTE